MYCTYTYMYVYCTIEYMRGAYIMRLGKLYVAPRKTFILANGNIEWCTKSDSYTHIYVCTSVHIIHACIIGQEKGMWCDRRRRRFVAW